MRKVFNTACFFVAIIIGVLAGSCASGAGGFTVEGGDTLTRRSELLTMVDCGDYVVAEIKNPWGDGLLARYLLVSDDYEGDLPEVDELTSVVITPVRRSVVFSSVYGGAIAELGAADAISGVTDGQYFVLPEIAEAIAAGRIADVGNSMSPSVESIVDCNPSALITSPYQGQEQGAIERLGIPVIAMVDYMEPTPLGRAEWLRLIGELYGRRQKADSQHCCPETLSRYETTWLGRPPLSGAAPFRPRQHTDICRRSLHSGQLPRLFPQAGRVVFLKMPTRFAGHKFHLHSF